MGQLFRSFTGAVVALVVLGIGASAAHAAFDPVYELKNFSKTTERFTQIELNPAFQLQLRVIGLQNELDGQQIIASDPPPTGRNFLGNLCAHHQDGCAGDPRLYAWANNGYGVVKPILFTARNGSTLSGHLWATKAGPAHRPGVVITNGSVQAPEELYWFAAETLAKAGYVVMTWDPQGQGYSDTVGDGTDLLDGVPSQTGEPFYDGTEDALDFFFSDAAHPYVPRPSCSSGTSHNAKQVARVKAGLDSAYNPMAALVDYAHVGLVGHSLGAGAVSYIGQLDPRVKAIVAYDNLSAGGAAPATCASHSSPRPGNVPITKPALGMSADYGLLPEPNTSEPDPLGKSAGSRTMSAAGVDTGELIIRGGTHYEFSFIPNPAFGGSLRGMDMVSWYTTAWLDKYLKGDPTADARLLTNRWRTDAQEAAVDPDHDGNLYSRYYRSRLDFHLNGGSRFTCEDVRTTCPLAADPVGGAYSYISAANLPDPPGPAAALLAGQSTQRPAGAFGVPPAATGSGGPRPGLNIVIPGVISLHLGL